jgi:hypothetical protein
VSEPCPQRLDVLNRLALPGDDGLKLVQKIALRE